MTEGVLQQPYSIYEGGGLTLSAKKSRLERWKEFKRNRVAYAFIAPFYILFAIFGLFPMGMAVMLGFFKWRGGDALNFIGIDNYIHLLTPGNTYFYKALSQTLIMGLPAMAINVFGAMAMAYVLNARIVKGENIFKTIYFMPMVTSAVASAVVFRALFHTEAGIINYLLEILGFDRINWLGGNGDYFKYVVIIMSGWQWLGWNLVIYFAGMRAISQDINEAAIIDGASHLRIFFNITLPILKPIILFSLINSTIGTVQLFTEPFMLTNAYSLDGGPGKQGLTVMMFILNQAPYGNNNYGYASAVANVLCILIIAVSLALTGILGEKDEPKLEKRRGRYEFEG